MNLNHPNSESTPIVFGHDIYDYLDETIQKGNYSKIFILVDSNTNEYCLPTFLYELVTEIPFEIIEIEAGEQHKNIETCVGIWEALTALQADRKSLFINLGGGVLTDLGGFVAATFKRGIDFIHVPTTLLSMVDAAIGGKTGVDLGVLKNQIGVFQPPKAILIYDQFLSTLPQNQMRSGLAEMLKHGLIQDANYWEQLNHLQDLNEENLLSLIQTSVKIKNDIVTKDPFEKNIRKALNFGHTIGHAIESYFLALNPETPVLHGEAIAAGMVIESYLSFKNDLIDFSTYSEIKLRIEQYFEPLPLNPENIEAILPYLLHDKKNIDQKIKFVLLNKIGSYVLDQSCNDVQIKEAFGVYMN